MSSQKSIDNYANIIASAKLNLYKSPAGDLYPTEAATFNKVPL
jgi:hypothetical protein